MECKSTSPVSFLLVKGTSNLTCVAMVVPLETLEFSTGVLLLLLLLFAGMIAAVVLVARGAIQ